MFYLQGEYGTLRSIKSTPARQAKYIGGKMFVNVSRDMSLPTAGVGKSRKTYFATI